MVEIGKKHDSRQCKTLCAPMVFAANKLTQAPSTYPDNFENESFYPFWVKVHTLTVFAVTKNEAFRKHSTE